MPIGDPAARACGIGPAGGDDVVGRVADVGRDLRAGRIEGIGGALKQERVRLEQRWSPAGDWRFQRIAHGGDGPEEACEAPDRPGAAPSRSGRGRWRSPAGHAALSASSVVGRMSMVSARDQARARVEAGGAAVGLRRRALRPGRSRRRCAAPGRWSAASPVRQTRWALRSGMTWLKPANPPPAARTGATSGSQSGSGGAARRGAAAACEGGDQSVQAGPRLIRQRRCAGGRPASSTRSRPAVRSQSSLKPPMRLNTS